MGGINIFGSPCKNPLDDFINPSGYLSDCLFAATLVSRYSVSGSGWILSVNQYGINEDDFMALKIDGSYIIGDANNGVRVGKYATYKHGGGFLLKRFETSFEVFDSANYLNCFYLEGDKIENSVLKYLTSYSTTHLANLKLSVSGKGWITGISASAYDADRIKLIIDGVTVIPGHLICGPGGNIPFLVKYNSNFRIYGVYSDHFRSSVNYTEV